MATLRINGTVIYEGTENTTGTIENAYVEKEILLSTTRSETAVVKEELKPDDIYEIITADGVSWIMRGDELRDNYTRRAPSTRGGSSAAEYELTTQWIVPGAKRGLGDILNFKKLIKWGFKKAPVAEFILPPIVKKIDEHLVPEEGLFTWNYKEDFGTKITAPSQLSTTEEILVFIHGTIANAQGTYGGLFNGDNDGDWKLVREKYNERVYTFQHHTLGKTPLENALDLLSVLPSGVKINLVTSSRGGLIGELLTMTSVYKGNKVYLDTLRSTLAAADRHDDIKVLDKIIAIGKTKKITINDYHRVACPASGTTLLSGRLDIYLKVVLNLIGLIPPLNETVIYGLVKSLLLDVVKSKSNADVLPGVEAMTPGSPFIKGMNAVSDRLNAKLKIIAGDVDPEGFFKTLAVFLVDVLYWADHDFIVNSAAMFRGMRRTDTWYIFHKANTVSHFNYYKNAQTRTVLYDSLKGLGTTTMIRLPDNIDLTKDPDTTLEISRGLYTDRLVKVYEGKATFTGTDHPPIKIDISIKNGDLGYAQYPIVVGHIKGDGIVSSEKAIDRHVGYRLSQLHKAGIYPGNFETSEVFFTESSGFRGAVVIGLGASGKLTGQSLAAAYQHGAVNFALKSRDEHHKHGKAEIGISTLLVGSDYAGVSIRTAIRSMIDGISAANQQIRLLNDPSIPVIRYVEIVEQFYDRAILTARFISYLMGGEYEKQLVKKEPLTLQKTGGAQKRIPDDYSQDWWYRLQITAVIDNAGNIAALHYLLMNNSAKADAMQVEVQGEFLEQIIKASVSESHSDDALLKLLFNMLVPNSIKEFTNDRRNILLLLEGRSADIPWEMLFNKEKDGDLPISVKSGMIRQLRVDTPFTSVTGSAFDNILIVGNPLTNDPGFPSLEGATAEAELVYELMNGTYNCNRQIEKPFMDIMKALIDSPYRIMHLAGHGDYDPENPKRSGMILSDGIRLSPAEITKLAYIPELVFINCCHLGKTKQSKILWNELAANLGTEFIKCGVKCVVAAGWAVSDQTALTFAEQFYRHMLDGNEFGEAVKKARAAIYHPAENDNTWGAYQCYGDPFYKFKPTEAAARERKRAYNDVAEMIMEIENLTQQIDPKSTRDNHGKTEAFISRIGELCMIPEWMELPEVIEAIGNCYCELGNTDKAIEHYRRLLSHPSGSYQLESLYRLSRLAVEKASSILIRSPKDKQGSDLLELAHHITDVTLQLSNTPDKHRLRGGNMKREASIYQAKKRIATLVHARNEYQHAFEMTLKKNKVYDHHALHSWIVLNELLRSYTPSLAVQKNNPLEHLDAAVKYLNTHGRNVVDLANLSAQAELEFCRLFINKRSAAARRKTEKEICRKYEEGWNVEGSFSKAKIIISNLDLLIQLLKDRKNLAGVLQSVNNIKAQLESIFNLTQKS